MYFKIQSVLILSRLYYVINKNIYINFYLTFFTLFYGRRERRKEKLNYIDLYCFFFFFFTEIFIVFLVYIWLLFLIFLHIYLVWRTMNTNPARFVVSQEQNLSIPFVRIGVGSTCRIIPNLMDYVIKF